MIKCAWRLCFERYHANIRDENDGSRLPLFKLLDRVFDKLPMKIKSEEAKAIDNVTIGDKKNKWGASEWEKRISSVSGLDTEAQVLSTCWLPAGDEGTRESTGGKIHAQLMSQLLRRTLSHRLPVLVLVTSSSFCP